jgi:hypothetical protein
MANERWAYHVEEVKPGFLGKSHDAVQERLTRLGMQGWELVAVIQPHRLQSARLYLKKPLS